MTFTRLCQLRAVRVRRCASALHQLNRSEIEIEILRRQAEASADIANGLLEAHESGADRFDFGLGQRFRRHAANSLPFHQLAKELDDRQHELRDRLLHVFGVGVPSKRRRLAAPVRWCPPPSACLSGGLMPDSTLELTLERTK